MAHLLNARGAGWWPIRFPKIEHELPESIRSMIEKNIGELTDADRRLNVRGGRAGPGVRCGGVARALEMDPPRRRSGSRARS